jgi:hypothetical protein
MILNGISGYAVPDAGECHVEAREKIQGGKHCPYLPQQQNAYEGIGSMPEVLL